MTNLQAEYSKLVEQRRHNLITETQSDRQLDEQGRHNLATEQLTDAQNAITVRGQDLNRSLTEARMLLDKSISDAQLANSRYIEEYRQEMTQAINQAKNDVEIYKANITKLQNEKQNILKARELGISEKQLDNATRKTDAEIKRMTAEVLKWQGELEAKAEELSLQAQKLELEYAKNPKARIFQMGFTMAEGLKDYFTDAAKSIGGTLKDGTKNLIQGGPDYSADALKDGGHVGSGRHR